MTDTAFILITALLIMILSLLIVHFIKRRKYQHLPVDEMDGHDFEYHCADLLTTDGFENVEVTRGSGDFGVDILAEKDGVTYAFQCKCYDKPIGVKAVQEIYAGRDFYNRMLGVVMTNQYYTRPAIELADKLKIILWDRDKLKEMER